VYRIYQTDRRYNDELYTSQIDFSRVFYFGFSSSSSGGIAKKQRTLSLMGRVYYDFGSCPVDMEEMPSIGFF
jgi:hypothetical protein